MCLERICGGMVGWLCLPFSRGFILFTQLRRSRRLKILPASIITWMDFLLRASIPTRNCIVEIIHSSDFRKPTSIMLYQPQSFSQLGCHLYPTCILRLVCCELCMLYVVFHNSVAIIEYVFLLNMSRVCSASRNPALQTFPWISSMSCKVEFRLSIHSHACGTSCHLLADFLQNIHSCGKRIVIVFVKTYHDSVLP